MVPPAGRGPDTPADYYHHPQQQRQQRDHQQQHQTPQHHYGTDHRLNPGRAYVSPPTDEPYAGRPPLGQPGPSSTPLSTAAIGPSHSRAHGGPYTSFHPISGSGQMSGDDDDAASPSSQGRGYEQTPQPNNGLGASAGESRSDEVTDQSAGSTKKRKTVPGSRGVANLTPEQLAKKRANDREAQRAIRERQKLKNEHYEREIRELKSQQPYQELQAALRQKAAVEAELSDIKRALASVVALVQPIISRPAGSSDQPSSLSPSPNDNQNHLSSGVPQLPPSFTAGSTPTSATSPASAGNQARWQSEVSPVTASVTVARPVPNPAQDYPEARVLEQQRRDLVHGLELGPERLELEFLVGPNQKIPKIQSGVNGARDSPNFRHVPLKHDWTDGPDPASTNPQTRAPAVVQRLHPSSGFTALSSPQQQDQQQIPIPPPSAPPRQAPSAGAQTPTLETAPWFIPLKNCAPTCALDSILLDFLAERRQRAAEGLPLHELVGPRYPSVSSLLNPSVSRRYSHPLSKLFTDVVSTFPHLSTLPERIAVVHGMFLVMRWQIDPTHENWLRMPPHFRPRPIQQTTSHPAWLDYIAFPDMRHQVITDWDNNDRSFTIDEFFIPFTSTLNLSWPYEETDTLLMSPDGKEVMINPVYERHMSRLSSWTLGEAYARTFPKLMGTFNLRRDGS